MTMPVRKDLTCYKGQTYSQDMYFKQNSQPVDLTGIIAKAQIRPSENSETLTAEFSCGIVPVEGKLTLSLAADVTAELAPGFYAWDLQMTDSNDLVQYWIKGKFIVSGRVTV